MPVHPGTGESCALMAWRLCLRGAEEARARGREGELSALSGGADDGRDTAREGVSSRRPRAVRARERAEMMHPPDGREPQGVVRVELRRGVPKVSLEDETPRLVDDVHGEHHHAPMG